MKNPVMYIIMNKSLGMSAGKLAAQASHAAVRAARWTITDDLDAYFATGETKIVLEARDTEHMLVAERYLQDKGFKTHLVIDEGRTEIPAHSITALTAGIVDKNDDLTKLAFGDFPLYKIEEPKEDSWKLVGKEQIEGMQRVWQREGAHKFLMSLRNDSTLSRRECKFVRRLVVAGASSRIEFNLINKSLIF